MDLVDKLFDHQFKFNSKLNRVSDANTSLALSLTLGGSFVAPLWL